jgi:hypothetical protein
VTRHLRSAEDAASIDEYFNGFHDGFVRSVLLRSHDRFEAYGPSVTEIGHEVTGRFDAVIEFAHYNYAAGTQPAQRVVRATFEEVAEFHLDLREVRAEEWPLKVVEFRALPEAGAARFALDVMWGKLIENEWSTQQASLFTFAAAEFEETEAE